MKKAKDPKKSPKKVDSKSKDSGELRKPTKLKPLKEKEKKNWKNNLDDDDDFAMEEDDKFDPDFNSNDDDDDDDGFYDDNF